MKYKIQISLTLAVLALLPGCKGGGSDNTISFLGLGNLFNRVPGSGPGPVYNTPPNVITGLTAIPAGSNQINLSWEKSTDDITSQAKIIYEICQSEATGTCNTFVESASTAAGATTYSATGLNPATVYFFRVRAKDGAGNHGAASPAVTALTNVANTVNAPTFTPVANIYRLTQSVTINSLTAESTICYTANGVTPECDASAICTTGVEYVGQVTVSVSQTIKAIACKSGSAKSIVTGASYAIDITPPGKPVLTGAESAGDSQIYLSWEATLDDVSEPGNIVYEICQSETIGGCDSFTVSFSTGAGATIYSVDSLSPNTTYFFRIRATDEAGNIGDASSEISATTSTSAPTMGDCIFNSSQISNCKIK